MKKTILITGASRGIGKAIADNLIKDYNVVATSRTIPYKESESFLSLPYDIGLSNGSSIKKLLCLVMDKFGRIDVLINNAGIMYYSSIENISHWEFDETFNVNVRGNLWMTQEVLGIMKAQKNGYIINIGSTRAITGAPLKGLYSMSKFALRALTQTIQLEYKEYGIKSTIICLGVVDTESSRKKYTKKELQEMNAIEEMDIVKTIKYLLSLSKNAYVPEIIIGGKL